MSITRRGLIRSVPAILGEPSAYIGPPCRVVAAPSGSRRKSTDGGCIEPPLPRSVAHGGDAHLILRPIGLDATNSAEAASRGTADAVGVWSGSSRSGALGASPHRPRPSLPPRRPAADAPPVCPTPIRCATVRARQASACGARRRGAARARVRRSACAPKSCPRRGASREALERALAQLEGSEEGSCARSTRCWAAATPTACARRCAAASAAWRGARPRGRLRRALPVRALPRRDAGERDAEARLARICGWDAHVAHADRQHCWLRPAQRQLVPLEAMLLQPLPAFIWLDLDEDASADEAKAAFRKLSRKHVATAAAPRRRGSVGRCTRCCATTSGSRVPRGAEPRVLCEGDGGVGRANLLAAAAAGEDAGAAGVRRGARRRVKAQGAKTASRSRTSRRCRS